MWTYGHCIQFMHMYMQNQLATQTYLHWIARSRGKTGGLLGGVELLPRKLHLLSKDGDACTVILCWKSEKHTLL